MNHTKILLVGCGELGSRHLQAAAVVEGVDEIHVIDSREESITMGRVRLAEVVDRNPSTGFFWHTKVETCCQNGSLAIIATQARGRADIIRSIAKDCGYSRFLIEKIVTQSIEEYKQLIRFAQQCSLQIWVNCKTRAYQIHRLIKSKLHPDEPLVFTRMSGNFGLASNGIHTADLFQYYTGAKHFRLNGSRIDPILHTTKRGELDLSGTLLGTTEGGSEIVIVSAAAHEQPDCMTIMAESGRYIVDQFQQYALECNQQTQWRWSPLLFKENWMVSFMTRQFVTDIITQDNCSLPTLEQCFPAHEFILGALLPHFNQLRKTNDFLCPVT